MQPRRIIVTIEMTTSDTIENITRDYKRTEWDDVIHRVVVKIVKPKPQK